MSKKITIKRTLGVRKSKKNFLKENCGDSAAPGAREITMLSPEAAYDAGWADAINEISAVIAEMIPGAIPVDVGVPIDIAQSGQLEEDEDWIQDAEEDIEKRGTEGVCTGDKFGGPTCRKGTKRYNLAKTFRKMAKDKKK